MVLSAHESTSLRIANAAGGRTEHIRTFSGVRRDMTPQDVRAFMDGVNRLVTLQATNAAITTRTVLYSDEG